jgi:hypothetical protein
LNVTGRVVSPGFIDILADNSTSPETTYPIFEKYKVSDGVTTALQMHGGSPDCGAYYRHFANRLTRSTYGVSTFVMAIRARSGGKRQIEKNLDEGALGVSHSLEYQPAPYAEMLEYAKLAKKYERPMSSCICVTRRVKKSWKELTKRFDWRATVARAFTSIIFTRPAALSTWSRRSTRSARERTRSDDHHVRLSLLLLGHLSFQQPLWSRLATTLRALV